MVQSESLLIHPARKINECYDQDCIHKTHHALTPKKISHIHHEKKFPNYSIFAMINGERKKTPIEIKFREPLEEKNNSLNWGKYCREMFWK